MKRIKFTTAFAKPQNLSFTVNSQTNPEYGLQIDNKHMYCIEAAKAFSLQWTTHDRKHDRN